MDFILKEAQNIFRKVGAAAQAVQPESDKDKAELAKIEMRAELDPKVWSQIEGFVNQMLDLCLKSGGNIKQTIAELKEYGALKQREFEDAEHQKQAEKDLVKDDLQLSPQVQALMQPAPAAE